MVRATEPLWRASVTYFGTRELRYCPNAMQLVIWRQCSSCNRVDGARRCTDASTDANSQVHDNEPSFTPDAAEGGTRVRPTHDCGAVRVPRMMAGGRTERCYCKPKRLLSKLRLAGERRKLAPAAWVCNCELCSRSSSCIMTNTPHSYVSRALLR